MAPEKRKYRPDDDDDDDFSVKADPAPVHCSNCNAAGHATCSRSWCQKHDKYGSHTTEECMLKFCSNHDKWCGHSTEECSMKWCKRHKFYGHTTEQCTGVWCEACQVFGHTEVGCEVADAKRELEKTEVYIFQKAEKRNFSLTSSAQTPHLTIAEPVLNAHLRLMAETLALKRKGFKRWDAKDVIGWDWKVAKTKKIFAGVALGEFKKVIYLDELLKVNEKEGSLEARRCMEFKDDEVFGVLRIWHDWLDKEADEREHVIQDEIQRGRALKVADWLKMSANFQRHITSFRTPQNIADYAEKQAREKREQQRRRDVYMQGLKENAAKRQKQE